MKCVQNARGPTISIAMIGLFVLASCTRPASDPNSTRVEERKEDVVATHETISPKLRDSHNRMVATLADWDQRSLQENAYLGKATAIRLREELSASPADQLFQRYGLHVRLGSEELKLGNEVDSIQHYRTAMELLPKVADELPRSEINTHVRNLLFHASVACLRWGETENCCQRNTPDSCVLPIQGEGVHTDTRGSRQAIDYLEKLLRAKSITATETYRAKWLLNLAYMTTGEYPEKSPEKVAHSTDSIRASVELSAIYQHGQRTWPGLV